MAEQGITDLERRKINAGLMTGASVQLTGSAGQDILNMGKESFWKEFLNPLGLDKLAHFSTNYSLDKLGMYALEHFPDYLEKVSESENPYISSAGEKAREKYFDSLADPSLSQKAAFAFSLTTVAGLGKEFSDPYFDWNDIAANYAGTALAVVDEYGDGSIRRGSRKIIDDIGDLLEPGEKTEVPDEEYRELLSSELYDNMRALGNL